MIRKSLSLHRLSVPGTDFELVIATGSGKNVLNHIDTIDNKRALVSVGCKTSAKRAMAMYVDGFEGEVEQAKASIPATLVKSILGSTSYNGWNFYNAFNYQGEQIDVVVGSKNLATSAKIQQFAQKIASVIFEDGKLDSQSQTTTLLLIGPDAERTVMAFNYETDEHTVLEQPYGTEITRYSFAGDTLIALQAGTGNTATMTRDQIVRSFSGDQEVSWNQNVELDGEIDDLSLAVDLGNDNYAIVATGQYDGKTSSQVLTVLSDGDERQIMASSEPTELDDETASWGSLVRFDRDADVATFVNYNGGQDTVTRVPTSQLNPQAKQVIDQLAA